MTMLRRISFLLLPFVLPSLAPAAAPPVTAPSDAHELVLLDEARPVRLRFRIRLAGLSHSEGWERQVARLFAFLDADGDGKLSKAEAGRAPSREQWRQMAAGRPITPDAAPDFRALSGGRATLGLEQLKAYYIAS